MIKLLINVNLMLSNLLKAIQICHNLNAKMHAILIILLYDLVNALDDGNLERKMTLKIIYIHVNS